jgi:hypothetical protein
MVKAGIIGILMLIAGAYVVSGVILPQASVLLNRPDIDTWTGLGAALHLLGIGLLVTLFIVYMLGLWRSGHDGR